MLGTRAGGATDAVVPGVRQQRSAGWLRRAVGGWLAVVCGLACVLLMAPPSRADTSDDKQRVDHEIAQAQAQLESLGETAQQAALDLNRATQALPQAQAALAEAQGRVIAAQAAARQAKRQADTARGEADKAAEEYRQAAKAVEQGRKKVSDFVAAAYRGSNFDLLNAVLEAASPADLAHRVGYLEHISNAQQSALADLTAARMGAKQRSDVAEDARRSADALAKQSEDALQSALGAQQTAAQAAAQVQAVADEKARAAAAAEGQRGTVMARYEELKAQSEQLAADLRAAAARRNEENNNNGNGNANGNGGNDGNGGGDFVPHSGGKFQMPVSGWKSSDFGMRYDPYYQVWQLHAGTDFAAPGGAPIVAAADGQVARTGWYGGYGNYTCIYHGNYNGKGLSTCYAHQSAILVSTGQWVSRGQLIGRVGTTGASTGCHLHFEVRLDGTPVEPLNWL